MSLTLLSNIFRLSNLKLLGGLYLGWGIGANDSANIFGTAVATNSIKYRSAIWLIAVFVVLGASCHGWKLYKDYDFSKSDSRHSQTSEQQPSGCDDKFSDACISTLAAAIAVTVVTVLSVPASTSQAAVGAYMGILIAAEWSFSAINWNHFLRMLICWVATPIGAAVLTIMLYKIVATLLKMLFGENLARLTNLYTSLLILAGCYGAYELGANNVVVTTGPYYKAGVFGAPLAHDMFFKVPLFDNPAFWASTIGGIAIAGRGINL